RAPAPPRRPDHLFRSQRRRARRGSPAPPARQSAAHPGYQEPGDAGPGQCRTEAAGLPRRRVAGPLRRPEKDPGRQQRPVHGQ
nr:hypothetical protein [Tanacetum cinerariifolium]